MARIKKAKPTLNSVFFATPEQRVLQLLLSEPTTSFTPRLILSKLKGSKGLGGTEGILGILALFREIGILDLVEQHRAVRLQDDNASIRVLKVFNALCDLESLRSMLQPISNRGILFGSRASGRARSDSDYDIFVVSETPEEIHKKASLHPMSKDVELVVWTPEQYDRIGSEDPGLERKLSSGLALWGAGW